MALEEVLDMDYSTFQTWQAYFSVTPEEMSKKVTRAQNIKHIRGKRDAAKKL